MSVELADDYDDLCNEPALDEISWANQTFGNLT